MNTLRALLEHPLTRGMDLEDPCTTVLRRQLIRSKPFLRRIYREWAGLLAASLPAGPGGVLELGSGGGTLAEHIPGLITSEILCLPGVHAVLDAERLPFADASLRAIVLTNVLHHLGDPARFFAEAGRCVRAGGVLAMVEPWVTSWSRLVYTRLHHEPFLPEADWHSASGAGHLTRANDALPWIIFARDAARFAHAFPLWKVRSIELLMPLRYLLSGGVSLRGLMPGFSFGFWRALERAARPWLHRLAMFACIVLERRS